MKPMYTEALFALFLGLIVPGIVLGTAVAIRQRPEPSGPATEQTEEAPEKVTIPVLLRQPDGQVMEMDMDEYLIGVVCGEMPASFEAEALKAQAVVARTYALKAKTTGGKHGDGSVCADPLCCQAYIREEDYLADGKSAEELNKIRSAVMQTSGYVLVYRGELIEATYFSCSGGRTEDAAAVWGADFPYLRATDSPGEENAAWFTDSVYITRDSLCSALDIRLGEDPAVWIGLTTYTSGGGVNTMIIGEKEFTGTQLRSALGLRSTAFTASPDPGGVEFTTRGYGHRVGMSQYGADAMAAAGSTWEQILSHYYTGTQRIQWTEN